MDLNSIHEFDAILPDVPFRRSYVEIAGEIWKMVPYENIKPMYLSNYGRIRNHKNTPIKASFKRNRKYARIIYTSGQTTTMPLDRLMMVTFMDKDKGNIIHIDGDTSNNDLTNLTF